MQYYLVPTGTTSEYVSGYHRPRGDWHGTPLAIIEGTHFDEGWARYLFQMSETRSNLGARSLTPDEALILSLDSPGEEYEGCRLTGFVTIPVGLCWLVWEYGDSARDDRYNCHCVGCKGPTRGF